MVNQTLIKRLPFSYRTLQEIKASEYRRFFSRLDGYELHVNHLGEVQWMSAEEADQQHEFFLDEESSPNPLMRFLFPQKVPDLDKVSRAEGEVRLQIRAYLEETYQGTISPETRRLLPEQWQFPLTKEDILHIPITIDILKAGRWKKSIPAASALLVLILALIALFFFKPDVKTGQLLVQTNVEGGRVFLNDQVFLGYTGSIIRNLPLGEHRISVKKDGYIVAPQSREIQVWSDSLQLVQFQLKPIDSQIQGGLKIIADHKDSDLFINGEYYGKLGEVGQLTLEQGRYLVEVRKEGFITIPSQQNVTIAAGDTTVLMLEQVSTASAARSSSRRNVLTGTLDITSNISGASIFLNGRDTGKQSDYVFTDLPLGEYRIRLVKDGFSSDPEEKIIRLTGTNPSAAASFRLKKESEMVSIETDQPAARIFADGELIGTGKFRGPLSIGNHEISFGEIPGYNSPSTRTVQVKPRLPLSISVKYFPQMRIVAEVSDNGNIRAKNCNVVPGYTFASRGFSPSDEAGPEVIYHKDSGNYFWKFGYAFPLRNPKGNDALRVTFSLPHELDYDQKFTLKIDAAASDDKYPLALTQKIDISIKFNNTILSYYYQPRTIKEIGGAESSEWDITPYIKPSTNSLEIATTENNNTFYFVKRIEIYN